MRTVLLIIVGLASVVPTSSSAVSKSRDAAVFVGEIVFIQHKDAQDLEREIAVYDHNNLQYLVVEVERVLCGDLTAGTIILGVFVGRPEALGLQQVAPNRYALDTSFWAVGTQIAGVVVRTTAEEDCRPPMIFPPGGERPSLDTLPAAESSVYVIDELNVWRAAPVYCAADVDLYRVW